MNINGHCTSDETLLRIDMDIEESVNSDSGGYVPKEIAKQSGMSVGKAWDNLDINMETYSMDWVPSIKHMALCIKISHWRESVLILLTLIMLLTSLMLPHLLNISTNLSLAMRNREHL